MVQRLTDLEDARTAESFRLWLEACCDVSPNARECGSKLYDSYRDYCRRQDIYFANQKAVAVLLAERFSKRRMTRGSFYFGIGLK